jgi:hypothetical protein
LKFREVEREEEIGKWKGKRKLRNMRSRRGEERGGEGRRGEEKRQGKSAS